MFRVFVVFFFQNQLFRKILRVSNSLDSDHVRRFVGPDPSLNCLQMLSAEDGDEMLKQIGELMRLNEIGDTH